MNNIFSITYNVLASTVDKNNNMRFDCILNTFQDIATFHSDEMGVSYEKLLNSSNAIWVLSKIKFVTYKTPLWNEKTTFSTYPTDISSFRFIREFTITGDMGAKVYGHSEWCVLDATTGGLRKSNSIKYPFDLERRTDNLPIPPFERLNYEVDDTNYVYTYNVSLTDIDCNNHTNNVAYARMALNSFDLDEYFNCNFKGLEIKFLNQTYIGNSIKIFKKIIEENKVYVVGYKDDNIVFSALFTK